jgi:ribosomal protein S18 acetylase RimI-like enzyme
LRAADLPGLRASIDVTLLSRVEDASLNASAPPQQRWMDGWLLRFSPGKAKRARCVNAVAMGRRSTQDKLIAATALFAGAELPLIFRLTPFTLPLTLDAQLDELGLRRFDDTRVMVLPDIASIQVPVSESSYSVRSIALEPFAQRIGALRGSPLAQRQAHAQRLANSPVPFEAFELRDGNEVLACGQYALEGDLVGVYDVFTSPAARGQGLAGRLCQHLLADARARGALHAYLQVESDNHPARSVYLRLGFCDGYSYHYRTLDPTAA